MQHNTTFQRVACSLAGAALVLTLALPFASPARADGAASTRNIILGAAAATAAVILYNNYHHKQVAHDTVVGYTRDGGIVYADGRIVYPNGTVVYANNQNGTPCSWDGSRAYCGQYATYTPRGDNDADDRYQPNPNYNPNYSPNYNRYNGNYAAYTPPNRGNDWYYDDGRWQHRGRAHGDGDRDDQGDNQVRNNQGNHDNRGHDRGR